MITTLNLSTATSVRAAVSPGNPAGADVSNNKSQSSRYQNRVALVNPKSWKAVLTSPQTGKASAMFFVL